MGICTDGRKRRAPQFEHQLALEVTAGTDPQRIRRLGQAEFGDRRHANGADAMKLHDAFEVRASAGNGGPQGGDIAAVGLGCLGTRGDEGRASTRLKNRKRSHRDVAAHGIEHCITIAYRLGEVGRIVIDDLIGAEGLDEIHIAFGARRDDTSAEVLALLDDLVTTAPPKDREVEAAKARARAQARYA